MPNNRQTWAAAWERAFHRWTAHPSPEETGPEYPLPPPPAQTVDLHEALRWAQGNPQYHEVTQPGEMSPGNIWANEARPADPYYAASHLYKEPYETFLILRFFEGGDVEISFSDTHSIEGHFSRPSPPIRKAMVIHVG